jgi:C4-dicarboxylate-specific signal transduction histidine kinase
MPDGGVVTTYTDITQRVRADEALKKINESLEHRVAERTAELSKVNTELSKAQTAAEEANLGKTRSLAAAGHDILPATLKTNPSQEKSNLHWTQ